MTSARDRIGLLLVIAAAAAAHLTYGAWVTASVWPDSTRYAQMAVALPDRLRNGLWDLWTVPGYPLLIWAVGGLSRRIDDLVLLQQVAAVAAAGLAWASARRLFGAGPALVGGLLFALSPVRHYYGQAVLTESPSETLLVAGFAAATFSLAAGDRARVALRALSGALLAAASLTRPNLVVAVVPLIAIPVVAGRRLRPAATVAAAAATALAAAVVFAPWFAFNASRGIRGLTSNAGHQLNEFANLLGLEPREDLGPWDEGGYTVEEDLQLREIGRRRLAADPRRTLGAMTRALAVLTVWSASWGDVSPYVAACTHTDGDGRLPGLRPAVARTDDRGRCDLHRRLLEAMPVATTIGWVGLAVFAVVEALKRRWDRAALALVPIAPLLGLVAMLQANTRYAAPLEGIALAIGWAWIASVVSAGRGPADPPAREETR